MAFRMGGFSKWLAYIAVGFLVGPLISLVSSLTGSVTGFLPGILGSVVGWALLGWIFILVVGLILKLFGARGK